MSDKNTNNDESKEVISDNDITKSMVSKLLMFGMYAEAMGAYTIDSNDNDNEE